jgi:hypothetical protein
VTGRPTSAQPVSLPCGAGLQRAASQSPVSEEGTSAPQPGAATRGKGAPWHFKLLVVGVTVYMAYRIYWLVEWLPKHL